MSNTTRSNGRNKISTFVQAAIYLVFILAIVSIAAAIGAFYEDPTAIEITAFLLAIGFISMGLAGYILFQSRKRIATLKVEAPPITTTIECTGCHEKVTREFQRGDYVFKEGEKCPKCPSSGMIVAIYREVKEKEKPVNV